MPNSNRLRQLIAASLLLTSLVVQTPAFAARTQDANFIRINTATSADQPKAVRGNLLLASDGNIYFVSSTGGNGRGAIGKLAPDGTITTLYAFPQDGDMPAKSYGGLIQASDGNLYGTSFAGGAKGDGAIFRLTLAGQFTLLHSLGATSTDARQSYAGLVQAGDGNLYGTTLRGGNNDKGAVFRIGLDGSNFAVIHQFNGTDGENPEGQLLVGSDGDLHGTTLQGGDSGRGVIYRISTGGVFALQYSFPALSGFDTVGTAINATGANPRAGLMLGADGNYYGTAYQGGPAGYGTVFRMTPAGAISLLHAFAGPKRDGGFPLASVVQDAQGNFYGTTQKGAYKNAGSAWRISSSGDFSLLHGFIDTEVDGSRPQARLLFANGSIYGASFDSPLQAGTLFKLDRGSNGALPIELSVSPADIVAGSTATLSWSAPLAASCEATGAWANGAAATSGTLAVTPAVPGIYTYVLSCTDGAGVVRNAYTALVVESPDQQPVDGGGGTGALSVSLLLLLAALLLRTRLREIFTACQ